MGLCCGLKMGKLPLLRVIWARGTDNRRTVLLQSKVPLPKDLRLAFAHANQLQSSSTVF